MHGQRIGYVRVSSFDQNPERQLDQVSVDRLFTDKASGKDTQRPELERLLALPDTDDDLIRHYTFSEANLPIARQRRGQVQSATATATGLARFFPSSEAPPRKSSFGYFAAAACRRANTSFAAIPHHLLSSGFTTCL